MTLIEKTCLRGKQCSLTELPGNILFYFVLFLHFYC
jgi:hypothetical protein